MEMLLPLTIGYLLLSIGILISFNWLLIKERVAALNRNVK
jgi:hypothetical protein